MRERGPIVHVLVHRHGDGETFSAYATQEAAERRAAELAAKWAAKSAEEPVAQRIWAAFEQERHADALEAFEEAQHETQPHYEEIDIHPLEVKE